MTFYCGIDLHAKKSQLCIIDGDGKKVKEGNLYNDLPRILEFLDPFGKDVQVAIECTINWYWLVDGLKDAGYDVRLAHTLGLYMITGAKVKPTGETLSSWRDSSGWANSRRRISTRRRKGP